MKRGSAILAVCLLVLLSGCSAILGPTNGGSPPGVENGSLNQSEVLLDAHAEALTSSGYSHTLVVNQTETVDGSVSSVRQEQQTSVSPGAKTYRFEVDTTGASDSRLVLWGNESAAFRQVESGDSRPQYSTGQPTNATLLTGVNFVRPFLAGEFDVAETTTRDGQKLVVLESTGEPIGTVLPERVESVSTYEARIVVDTEGRIHRFTADTAYTVDNRSMTYHAEYEVTQFENPDVERPSWVDSSQAGG